MEKIVIHVNKLAPFDNSYRKILLSIFRNWNTNPFLTKCLDLIRIFIKNFY